MNEELYKVVDYILNVAGDAELEVIGEAFKKRLSENRPGGALRMNPARMAKQSSDGLAREMEASRESITRMVSSFAADIIRKNAPELNERQVAELLSEFMPESAGGKPAASRGRAESGLPPGMIIQMVEQFVAYSEGRMSPAEQIQLEQDIPGWKEKYWRSMGAGVRKIVSLYLNGDIDRERMDAHVQEILGL